MITLKCQRFDMKYMNFRVKACNKAVSGDFSEPVTLETPAFCFQLDAGSAHQNLRVEESNVEWDATGGKVQDMKIREKDGRGRGASPCNSPASLTQKGPSILSVYIRVSSNTKKVKHSTLELTAPFTLHQLFRESPFSIQPVSRLRHQTSPKHEPADSNYAFCFQLDAGSAHQNLRVEESNVEWDATGGKVQDMKIREKDGRGRGASPCNSPARSVQSPKRMPSARVGRDRFTAESYTVLGDTLIDGGECYWEVRFDKDSKAFAVGVTYRSLGKFDQLGKTSASWCLHLNNWLQVTFAAKHGNKARILDAAIPNRIGLHCNYDEGMVWKFFSKYWTPGSQLCEKPSEKE
ncbi:fibronectin type III and SPRY domain-containing protein 1 [Xenopus laevis]|uniref:Fibronectin type III and SPRY domain-containing protein 1 n=1 Tax=Xenopus laevis TaxID=8355 RepID=A0A8J1LZM4_XENLA|nr:fibronectin type III and SPRY domain-containing protein 1 [Xenopus laevis]